MQIKLRKLTINIKKWLRNNIKFEIRNWIKRKWKLRNIRKLKKTNWKFIINFNFRIITK